MSAITNNEAIKFSNEKMRIVADLMAQLYNFGKSVNDEWISREIGSIIPDDSEAILHDSAFGTDGTDGDGRPIVNGADLNSIMVGTVDYFIALLEENDNERLKIILNVAVNYKRKIMADYYVRSTGGSNGNAGTSFAAGWATIAHAITNTIGGDRVFVCADNANPFSITSSITNWPFNRVWLGADLVTGAPYNGTSRAPLQASVPLAAMNQCTFHSNNVMERY